MQQRVKNAADQRRGLMTARRPDGRLCPVALKIGARLSETSSVEMWMTQAGPQKFKSDRLAGARSPLHGQGQPHEGCLPLGRRSSRPISFVCAIVAHIGFDG